MLTIGLYPRGKGDRWDDPPMRSFFHTLKAERVHHRVYATRDQARRDLLQHIEGFYNPRHPHSARATSSLPNPSVERQTPSHLPREDQSEELDVEAEP